MKRDTAIQVCEKKRSQFTCVVRCVAEGCACFPQSQVWFESGGDAEKVGWGKGELWVRHFPLSGATFSSSGLFLRFLDFESINLFDLLVVNGIYIPREQITYNDDQLWIHIYIYIWWYDKFKALMISSFQGQSRRLRPKLQPSQGAPFGFQVYCICILILHTSDRQSHLWARDISLQPLMNTNRLST